MADGQWTFGWTHYRYDETGYGIGEGSIPSENVKRIALDWIDGGVEIIACEDRYISISEVAASELSDTLRVRWKSEEDGTLRIKYQASGWFFGHNSDLRDKKLTLRIPKSLFSQLEEIAIETRSANAVILGVEAEALYFDSDSGSLVANDCRFSRFFAETEAGKLVADGVWTTSISAETARGDVELYLPACPAKLEIDTEKGDVTLRLPAESSFTMDWETDRGQLSYDFPLTQSGNRYLAGNAQATFSIETETGNLVLMKYE